MPQLEQGFEIFANWQTIVFCLGVYLLTYAVRTVIENAPLTKKFSQGWLWTTILLPLGPIGTGVLLALLSKKFPWPVPVTDSMSAKLMYGGICGMGSGWMFARFRDWVGVAADNGNLTAAKVAATMLNRPVSATPPPMALGPSQRPAASQQAIVDAAVKLPPNPPPTV